MQRRPQHGAGIDVAQALDAQFRQLPQRWIVAALARREDEGHRLRQQAASDERERLRRSLIEPLGVVDEADQGALLGGVRQQAECGEPDEEGVGCLPLQETEHNAERLALRWGEPTEVIQERSAQLVEPGERELHLGLDAGGACDAALGCAACQVLQQRGLAYPGFAAEDEYSALASADARHELVERPALAAAALQPEHVITLRHGHRRSTQPPI